MSDRDAALFDLCNFVAERIAEERGAVDDRQVQRLDGLIRVLAAHRAEWRPTASQFLEWNAKGRIFAYEVAERNMWNLCAELALWWSDHPDYDEAWRP